MKNNMKALMDKQINRRSFIGNRAYVELPDYVKEIRALLKLRVRIPKIAKLYSLNRHTVSDINLNKVWFDPKWEPMVQPNGCVNRKLKPNDIPNIKAAIDSGEVMTKIAKRYGVHPQTIRDIKHGRRWQNIRD